MKRKEMNVRHTPGPWSIWEARPQYKNSTYEIERPYADLPEDSEQEFFNARDRANRALIAAAPELLEAARAANSLLQRLMTGDDARDLMGEIGDVQAMIAAAGAKACGEQP